MANLKEVRSRISSVISTQQITKAMKMVSAAKLRRAQDRIVLMRPYANKLGDILSNLTANLDGDVSSPYAIEREPKKVLLVPITSNRGLCGGFNANITKKTVIVLNEKYSEQQATGNVHILSVGKKADDYFRKHNYNVVGQHNELWNDLNFNDVNEVITSIMDSFVAQEYDRVEVIYNEFKNPVVQIVRAIQFLPIVKAEQDEKSEATTKTDYILEPTQEEIVNELIPKSLKIQFYKALLDSNAAEHGARMGAMDQATENANEILRDLKISYNRARQAAITTELTEIVAGANAL
ncbi:MAG: F-type H+-transporting ATPase subunit gamma [Sphingobacteriales bacterium]|jgi:F-type H+-transporting ATPase subunit gamma